MIDKQYISKNLRLEDSQNYAFLRETGIKYIEKLAHKLWTDYNIHDPGITLLELLAYAITDLGLRTGYDMKDLLTESVQGVLQNNSNFHTAFHIFPNSPLTFNDLRKVLIDIEGVRNVWISKNTSIQYWLDPVFKTLKGQYTSPQDQKLLPLNGLFDVLIEYEDADFVDRNPRAIHFGPGVRSTAENFIPVTDEGILFKVHHEMVLVKVHIYPGMVNPGINDQLKLKLYRRDAYGAEKEIIFSSHTHTIPPEASQQKTPIGLNISLEAGYIYRLTAEGSQIELHQGYEGDYTQFYLSQVVSLLNGYGNGKSHHKFNFFYDWVISYAVSPLEIQRVQSSNPVKGRLGLPANLTPSPADYILPNSRAMGFRVLSPLILRSIGVYPREAGRLKLRLLDSKGLTVLQSSDFEVKQAGVFNKIDLSWTLAPGIYQLDAFGTTIPLCRIDSKVNFPYELDDAIQLLFGIKTSPEKTYNIYYFFFNWEIEYTPSAIQISKWTSPDIQLAVKDRLHVTRNLCEDFIHIRDLKLEEIGLCADIEVRPDVDINAILAIIYAQVEHYVSPPVNFYTLEELQARGKTMEQIFDGPMLEHGFIDDDEFRALERRSFLRTSDVIQLIMDVPGVLAVKEIYLLSYVPIAPSEIKPGDQIVLINQQTYRVKQEPWVLNLESIEFSSPDFNPERSKIIFYKNGLPYFPQTSKVLALYREKRIKNYKGKLKGHLRDRAIPIGDDMDLEAYNPVQNALPNTYYTGQNRIPDSYSKRKKAQARQLKAYMLFFEQLLVNYLAQLGHVKELFSWQKGEIQTYFTHPIPFFNGLDELYVDYANLQADLQSIIEDTEVAAARKNRFLDHLLGRFAEDLSDYDLMMHSIYKENAATRVILDKQCLLSDYPGASSLRGKSFDYRIPRDPNNLSGFQRRMYRLLGIHSRECQILNQNLASKRFVLNRNDTTGIWQIQLLDESLSVVLFETEPDEACKTEEQVCAFLDNLLPFGALESHWRFQAKSNGNQNTYDFWELVQVCKGKEKIFGRTSSHVISIEAFKGQVLAHFIDYANREGFQLIEHILLRRRSLSDPFLRVEVHSPNEPCDCVEVHDPYSFRATIVLPSWPERFQNIRFRQYIEQLLRLEAPAHVYLKICWINHCQMQKLETHYFAWQEAHAKIQSRFKGVPSTPAGIQVDPLSDTCIDDPSLLTCYHQYMNNLLDVLYDLNTVFPMASLHDCAEESNEDTSITLNNTNLGSL